MNIVHRDDLHHGGFAGLRETRLIMSPQVFKGGQEPGTWGGLGHWVYLADAKFNPGGETHLHPHREIDVISLIADGRIAHEGSLEHGQELKQFDVQVQRAGGEGFTHNEINPDDFENRMIQFWVVPEQAGEPASYRLYHVENGQRVRVYGGPDHQHETYPAQTVLEVARVPRGDTASLDSPFLAYLVTGAGQANGQDIREGHMISDDALEFQATMDCMLIMGHLA